MTVVAGALPPIMLSMAFTLEDIDRAHKGVSQATVGDYLKALHGLGVAFYRTHISDGHSDYVDSEGNSLSSAPIHELYEVADHASVEAARLALDAHARGKTDYYAFSRQLADAGVAA
ncbi:DUF1398 domain-containing protein [Mesorhizobium sp. INR15]|nr:DUF1398 domain-containing protein [Mesorhizobium sp. INR15]